MGDATRVRFKKFFVPLFLYSESLSQQNINFNSNVWLLFRRIKNVTVYMQNATPDNMLGLVRRLATSESSSSLAFNDNAGDPTSSQRLNREHERRAKRSSRCRIVVGGWCSSSEPSSFRVCQPEACSLYSGRHGANGRRRSRERVGRCSKRTRTVPR